MSDLDATFQTIERSAKVRFVQDMFGHEAIEVRSRWSPFWRRLELSRKDAATVCRTIRRTARVCPATGRVWMPALGKP